MKKHWKLSLILLVLLVGVAGATLWFTVGRNWTSNQSTGDAYTAYVQDEKGTSLEKVYVMLYAEDGTEITWLPYVTNTSGKVQFVEGVEEGCYVKVVGVPLGYKLDESVKYEFDESKNVKITLVEDDSVYVAKIGETKFMSFASALSVANASSEDVTIELMADAVINTGTVKNNYGKTITVNGNGHTVTTEGGNNAFLVNQEEGLVAFENMNIVHKNTGATFQVNALVTLSLTDVSIDATKGSAYNYALINTLAVDGTTTLNMTRVDIKMAVQTPAKANEAGIIRTGNTSGTKTVDINMTDCNFDTEEATGRQCIVVMKNTVANIKATNCSFKSGDSPAIWAAEQSKMQTLVMNGSQAVSTISPSSATPIKGYAAMIGNTYYLTFAHAAEVAAKSKSNVTIKAVADVTMKTCTIKNEYGKLITIDGNGKTITTSGGSNAFILGNHVAFKNMKVNHKNTGSVFHMTSTANLKATDVTINATEASNYNYTLVNTLAEGETTVDFTRVNVKMAVEKKGSDKYASVIRTGNDTEKKTVVINLTDCNFDTTKATGRSGIAIVPNTKATVNLKNTTITTMDNFAIRSNEQDIIWNNADTKLTSLQKEYQDYPVEYYLAKIGDVFYTLKQAIAVANAANGDTQINLLANYTIKNYKINNEAGKLITLDGCDHTITTSGGNHAFEIGNNITLKNMKIVHKNYGSAVQIASAGNVTLSKVELDATSPSNTYTTKNKEKIKNTYTYALINVMAEGETNLALSEVNVAMAVAGMGQVEGQSAILRTGNSGDAKKVNMTLQNCNFDATQATNRNGILIMKGTDADIKLTNTSIKTLDVAPIKNLNTTTGTAIVNEEMLTVKAKAYTGKQLTGYTIKIGDTWYASYSDVLDAAKTATEDVVIVLTKDIEYDLSTLVNVNGKKITIDTNGYTLTVTGTNSKVAITNYQAQLQSDSGTVYATLTNALKLVKENGIIKLAQDIEDSNSGNAMYEITKSMVIDGDGHTIKKGASSDSKKHFFNIAENVTKFTFKNATLVHESHGLVVQFVDTTDSQAEEATVTFENMVINATQPAGGISNEWALVNIMRDGKTNLTMDNVNVKMVMTSAGKDTNAAVLRTGNSGVAKDINITLKNGCFIDTSEAVGRHAITVTNDSTADIKLTDTIIKTQNVSAIKADSSAFGTVTVPEEGNGKNTIDVGTSKKFEGYQAQVGDVIYKTLKEAIAVVEEKGTVKLVQDVTVTSGDIAHKITKEITIDGNGNKITTTSSVNNLFETEKNVTLKNMTIVHNGTGAVVRVSKASTLTMADVIVDAKNPGKDGYKYALFNISAKKGTGENATIPEVTLDFTNVTVDMDVATNAVEHSKGWGAILRTGNENDVKVVNVNLKGSTLDATNAIGRHGILVMKGTNATITLDATSEVMSYDVSAIQTLDTSAGKVIVETEDQVKAEKADAFEGYQAKVGNQYTTFANAISLANAASEATTIELMSDVTVKSYTINKNMIINGNGFTMTTKGANDPGDAFLVKGEGRQFTLNDLNIVHQNHGTVVKWDEKTAWGADVTLKNVNIDATNPSAKGYEFALFNILPWSNESDKASKVSELTFENVDVTMKVESKGKDDWMAIIRTGNSKGTSATSVNSHAKTVKISMKDSSLDTTEAVGRYGIIIQNTSITDVTLDNTTIKSGDVNAIRIRNNVNLNENGKVTLLNNSKVTSEKTSAFDGFDYHYEDVWYLKRPSGNPIVLTEDKVMAYDEISGTTVNTNGHCLKVTGTDDGSAIIDSEAMMTATDGTLYLTLREALERAEVADDNVVIAVRTDCEVDVTGISNVNGYTITVDTGDFKVTVKGNVAANVIIGDVYVEGTENKVYMSMEQALENQSTVYMSRDLEKDSLHSKATLTVNTNGHKLIVGDLNGVTVESEATMPVGEKTAYLTLEDAIKEASASSSDIIVTVKKAFTASKGYVIGSQKKLAAEGNITIDGGNCAITPAEGLGALFTVNHTGDVTFKNVKINAADVSGCKGIFITNAGKVTLDNPSITTKDALGVDNQSTALVKRTGGSIECTDVKLKVGSDVYTTYADALDKAKTATQDVVVELWSDISENMNARKIENKQAMITIDGNSCSFTLGNTSKNAFDIYTEATFKDIVIDYSGKGAVIRVYNPVDASLINVDINATTKESDIKTTNEFYRGTINLLASGTYKLKLTDVNIITKDVTDDGEKLASINNYDGGKEYRGIIVTGNNSSSQPKNITIEITNSKLDARQAKGRFGIYIRGYDNANISLVNSAIMTDNTPNTSGVKTNVIYAQAYKVTGGTANRTVSLESSRLEAYEGDVLKNEQNKAVNANVKVDIKDNNMPSVIGLDEEQQDDIVEVTLKLKMPKGILEKFLEKFEKWLQQINQDNKWDIQLLEN